MHKEELNERLTRMYVNAKNDHIKGHIALMAYQSGGIIIFEKDGVKYRVFFNPSNNGFTEKEIK